jgi:hypothetical protein
LTAGIDGLIGIITSALKEVYSRRQSCSGMIRPRAGSRADAGTTGCSRNGSRSRADRGVRY